MIESYEFGRMVIDGETFTSDIIIIRDRAKGGWWRKEGHRLDIDDVSEILQEKPDVLVVGTGYTGMMSVPEETRKFIQSNGIRLEAQPTVEAWKTYNEWLRSGRRIAAAFHLTC